MDWIKKSIPNILLLAVSIGVVLVVAEVVLRFTPLQALLPYEGMPAGYFLEQPEDGYDIAPNIATSTHRFVDSTYPIWSNEFGCFDTPYQGETPYVYLAGDSFTWGFTPFEQKWGTLLERNLGIRTMKCGVPGYGTKQAFHKAERILSQLPGPELVVLSYFENDESDDASYPNSLVYKDRLIKNLSGDSTLTYQELQQRLPQFAKWGEKYCMWSEPAHPLLQRAKCLLRQHSILYLLAQQTIKQILPISFLQRIGIVNIPAPAVQTSSPAQAEHLAVITAFSAFATSRNSKLFVVLIPAKETVADSKSDPYKDLKTFLTTEHVEYLDLAPGLRTETQKGKVLYWPHDGHWNTEGNAVVAGLITEALQKRIAHEQ